jgi:ech hydrogenase subunit F
MSVFKMAKTVLGSLVKKPATLMYPVIPREYGEKTRGHVANDIENCIFCGMCTRKCPSNALSINKEEKTWTINRLSCIQCNCCVEVCPKHCLHMENTYTPVATGSVREVYKDARVPDNTANN